MCSSSQRKIALGLSRGTASFGTRAKSLSHCSSVRQSGVWVHLHSPHSGLECLALQKLSYEKYHVTYMAVVQKESITSKIKDK